MLQAVQSNTENHHTSEATMPAPRTAPLLVDIAEFRRLLGGMGKTCAYATIERHKVRLLKIGSLTRIEMTKVERVIAEIKQASAPAEIEDHAKELAAKSVAARRRNRARS